MKIHHLLFKSTRQEIKKVTNISGNQLRRASDDQQTAHEQTTPNYISTN